MLLVDRNGRLGHAALPLFDGEALSPCGHGCTFDEALERVRGDSPDVVVVELSPPDDAMPAIEAIMAHCPRPILALHPAGGVPRSGLFRALDLGALEIDELPRSRAGWAELRKKLLLLSQVRVVQHVGGKRRQRPAVRPAHRAPFPLVAIAASLGGPKALSILLRTMPAAFRAPMVVCQHISAGFTVELAQWLSFESPVEVVEARGGARLEPGTVYVAPSNRHLLVTAEATLVLDDGPPVMGFRPSCDKLLSSAAQAFGERAIGVVLTGMGRDGARGLMEIRRRGGRTLAQDERTSAVFGMPREAIELGAAAQVLPLEQIGPTLIHWVNEC